MNKRKTVLRVLIVGVSLAGLWAYFNWDRISRVDIVAGKPNGPAETAKQGDNRAVGGETTGSSKQPFSVSVQGSPPPISGQKVETLVPGMGPNAKKYRAETNPIQSETSLLSTSIDQSPVKLCAGGPIQSGGVDFSHGDFAQLIGEIIGLEEASGIARVFELLESRHIAPVKGWSKTDPHKAMTPGEMEEVRCSLSLAFRDGLIQVSPLTVVSAIDRFCLESKAVIGAEDNAGTSAEKPLPPSETGYQGGANWSVNSSSQ